MFLELCYLFLLSSHLFLHCFDLSHGLFPFLISLLPLYALTELMLLHDLSHLTHFGVHRCKLSVTLQQLLLKLLVKVSLILKGLLTLTEELI